jgi:UDP-glucuronate decarboxylase
MNEQTKVRRNPILLSDLISIANEYQVPWHHLKDKTVLITGASGFLAAYMVETMLYLNDALGLNIVIIGLVRNQESFNQRFISYLNRPDLKCLVDNICSPLKKNEKIDFIIHAASQASPKFYAADPVGTLSANVLGTNHLLELARAHAVDGFLYFSSAEVYGESSKLPTSENDYGFVDPLDVRSCYAESKRMGENMCVSWHHQYNVPAKIVRPFHTYGPGMKLNDGRVYADFVQDILAEKDILLKSEGLNRRSFCYLADATAGFWMVLLTGNNAQAYNIGNPAGEISIKDLALLLTNLYPEKKLTVRFGTRDDIDLYLPSQIKVTSPNIKLAEKLGWLPKTSIKDGFRRTIEYYQLNQ